MSESTDAARPAPIAVVGLAAVMPGARNVAEYWGNIVNGRDLITEVPPTHWSAKDYYDPDPQAADKTYCRRGAFLPDLDFDPMAHGLMPNTLPTTDSAQLLGLVVADQLLADLDQGLGRPLERSRVSVILGSSITNMGATMNARIQRPVWLKALRSQDVPESDAQAVCDRIEAQFVPWQEASFPGLLPNVIAGRIANRLDLHGTNCTVDAACASSLAAISAAVNELSVGHADLVVTGGVDATNMPLMYVCFSKTPAMSPTGDIRPFSEAADGTMLGEGVAMVGLKRLRDAERDSDRIYAVIRGIGSSSDGRGNAIYAPLPTGQARALRRTYEVAGYGPETVELVEAHGTGTRAGDAAEFAALREVFDSTGRRDRQWCGLGSVKSQIGHTKSAAGAASLIKAVLALHHRVLPPTIKVERPNPKLEIDDSPFYLNTAARPWVRGPRHPRRASLSSFGFGGSNFHVAVEEHTTAIPAWRLRTAASELVLFSAASASDLLSLLRGPTGPDGLPVLARRSQEGFDAAAPVRLSVVAADRPDLDTKLAQAADLISHRPAEPFSTPTGICFDCREPDAGLLAFVFPGQGSQYVGMGGAPAMTFPQAHAVWDLAASLDLAEQGLHEVVFPTPVFTDAGRDGQQRRLTDTRWAQPALAAHSLALLSLLRVIGLKPDCLAGHSLGELVALHAAGAFDAQGMLRLVRRRGELMAEAAAVPGAMLAVPTALPHLRAVMETVGSKDLWAANYNAPEQTVVSGKVDAIAALEAKLAADGIAARRLDVATAFHSPLVASAVAPLLDFLSTMEVSHVKLDVYGNADAGIYPADPPSVRVRIAEHLAAPVRFAEQIEAMYARGVRTFVEVGAGTALTGMIGRILRDRDHVALPLDRKGRDGVTVFHEALGRLAVRGLPMDLPALWHPWATPAAPSAGTSGRPRLTVKINGAPYGNPFLSADGAPGPAPSRPEVRATDSGLRSSTDPSSAATAAARRPAQPIPPATAAGTSLENITTMSNPEIARYEQQAAGASWLDTVREVQRQTAEAHAAFQQALSNTHQAFLTMAENTFAMLAGSPITDAHRYAEGPAPISAPFSSLNPEPAVHAALAPAAGSRPQPATREAGSPAATVQFSQGPVAVSAQAVSTPSASPNSAPAPGPADVSGLDLELLLSVVSQKTGYPAEMLDGEMDMESELGIDSIKKVEILSAVRERVQGLPEADSPDMAALFRARTLNEIVAQVGSRISQSSVPSARHAEAARPSASVPVPGPAGASGVDLELLLSVVSQKTGYPAEMLDGEMDMESELGIDSIKKVEILSAVRERVQGLPEADSPDMAALFRARTLNEIVALTAAAHGADAQDDAGQAAAEPQSAPAEEITTAVMRRLEVRALPAPACGLAMPGLDRESLIVVDGGSGLAAALVAELADRGIAAVATDTVSPDAGAVILLGGLAPVADPDQAFAASRTAFQQARTVAARMAGDGGLFVTVQDTGGGFGLHGGDAQQAWMGGLAALARTAAREWPAASVKAIDLQRAGRSDRQVAGAIAAELQTGGPTLDVALRADGSRWTIEQVAGDDPTEQGAIAVDEDSVIIVTGGARGITAAMLRELASARRPKLLLIGRTPLSAEPNGLAQGRDEAALTRLLAEQARASGQSVPALPQLSKQAREVLAAREVRNTIAALEEAGSTVRYASVSITDSDALGHLVQEVRRDWGPITGIIHAAGVLADKHIADKTDRQFDDVFNTKAGGLQALLSVTADDPLKLLYVFSSVAARFGNAGQCDYAMANEVLNQVACAQRRLRPTCHVRSIGWGPWEGGMVTESLAAHFRDRGVPLIPLQAGARSFLADLAAGPDAVQILICAGDGALAVPGEARFAGQVRVGSAAHGPLADHDVAGTPVLPVAMAVEWFAAAAHAVRPNRPVVLRDVRVLSRLDLPDLHNGGHQLTIEGRAARQPGEFDLQLGSGRAAPHYRATLVAQAAEPLSWAAPDGLVPVSRSPLYDGQLLFHGPQFQVLQRIDGLSATGADAMVAGLREMSWPGEVWWSDPAAVDGALQVAVLWAQEALGKATLPMGIAEVRIDRVGPAAGVLRCVAVAGKTSADQASCDAALLDGDGGVHTELLGIHLVSRPDLVSQSPARTAVAV